MAKKKIRQYGLQLSFPEAGDYILGGESKLGREVLQESGQWDGYLPVMEYQNLGSETMACTAFGTLSAVEILIKKLYGNEQNFSDRWLAWCAGITQQGASPHQTAEYLRKTGSPFQERWDYTPDINTWEKFYETPPAKLIDYAKEDFAYNFKHEYVQPFEADIKTALKFSPLGFSVYAWVDEEGVFYKPRGATDNHWCVCYGWVVGEDGKTYWRIFDSYDNSHKLYADLPMIVKRFEITKKDVKKGKSWSDLLCEWFGFNCK